MASVEQVQTQQQDFFVDLASRLRATEGKYNLLRDRVLIINQNMIEEWKKTTEELHLVNDEIKEMKVDMFRMKETMKHFLKEMELFARKDEVKFLEKYINLWDPMKFVTSEELNKALEKKSGKS